MGINKEDVFEYLDDLRESGVINMFGTAPYIMKEFGVNKSEATKFLIEWMNSFGERHPESID